MGRPPPPVGLAHSRIRYRAKPAWVVGTFPITDARSGADRKSVRAPYTHVKAGARSVFDSCPFQPVARVRVHPSQQTTNARRDTIDHYYAVMHTRLPAETSPVDPRTCWRPPLSYVQQRTDFTCVTGPRLTPLAAIRSSASSSQASRPPASSSSGNACQGTPRMRARACVDEASSAGPDSFLLHLLTLAKRRHWIDCMTRV